MRRIRENVFRWFNGQDKKTVWDDHELPLLKTLASRITSELESCVGHASFTEQTTPISATSLQTPGTEQTTPISATSLQTPGTEQTTPISATSLQTQKPEERIQNSQTKRKGILKKDTKYPLSNRPEPLASMHSTSSNKTKVSR